MGTGTVTDFQAVSRQYLNSDIQILLERGYLNDYIKIQRDLATHKVLLFKNHFDGKKYEKKKFRNSNVGGKQLELMS